MRIHRIQLRGLTAPTGDHQLGLDPGYTVLRVSEPDSARRFVALACALLHPESKRAAQHDTSGRAVLTLALRSDGCLVGADFARGRVSLGRLEVRGGASKALSSDPHEIEAYLFAVGLPPADEFDRLHVFGAAGSIGFRQDRDRLPPAFPVVTRSPQAAHGPDELAASLDAERARLLAEHAEQALALTRERERLEAELEAVLAVEALERDRDDARIRELRICRDDFTKLEREHKATLAELEKNAALADSVEDFDARIAQFFTLTAERDGERAVVEDKRINLLADRARLRLAPRRLRVPIALGLGLGAAGAAAGAVGYPAGYVLAAAGVLALLVALAATRIARARLGRIESLLAVLRVRERTSERRFESDGAQIRGIMLALGVDSLDELRTSGRGFASLLQQAEAQKRRLAELGERYPAEARDELLRLEQAGGDGEPSHALRAARAALRACPVDVSLPQLPRAPIEISDEQQTTAADTAVDLIEKPEDEPEPASEEPGPEALIAATARVLGRSEAEVRARLGPVLPVYLRALSSGTFSHASAAEGGSWVLRGAAREEQPFAELPIRERELVRLAVQLALLEGFASDRRVPLFVGPDLPARGEGEQRALARAFKRLASVVQVIQVVTASEPWVEHAGKSFDL
jgi:hypothetical protein